MTLQEFRKKYPAYDDMSDEELVKRMHQRYYSDVPLEDFYSSIEYQPQAPVAVVEQATPRAISPHMAGMLGTPAIPTAAGPSRYVQPPITPLNAPEYDTMLQAMGKSMRNIPGQMRSSLEAVNAMRKQEFADVLAGRAKFTGARTGMEPLFEDIKGEERQKLATQTEASAKESWESVERMQRKLEPVAAKPGSAAFYGAAATSSIGEMAIPMLVGVLTKNPSATISLMYPQVYGRAGMSGRAAGLKGEALQNYATANALAETIPEYLPVSVILKPGTSLFKRLLSSEMAEVFQEEVTEVLQIGLDKGYIDKDMTWEQARQRLIDTGIVAGIVTPIQAGMMHPLVQAMNTQTTKTESTKEMLDRAAQQQTAPVAQAAPQGMATPEEYRGAHTAPMRDSGAPLSDLTDVYPDDIYGQHGAQYYVHHGQNNPMDVQSVAIMQKYRNHPNEKIAIYRAVPLSAHEQAAKLEKQMAAYLKHGQSPAGAELSGSEWYNWASKEVERLKAQPEAEQEKMAINPGDWVTINRAYAKEHGESILKGNYKIISKSVKASDIFTNGDSIHEWGYDPDTTEKMYAGTAAVTHDVGTLRQAYDMLEQGVDPEEVRKRTGWFQGPEHAMRFEISDRNAKLNLSRLVPVSAENQHTKITRRGELLGYVLDHHDLYMAYPSLSNIRVNITIDPYADAADLGGSFSPLENIINMTWRNPERVKRGLLHEIQHYIQGAENWAEGGTPWNAPRIENPAWQEWKRHSDAWAARPENKRLAEIRDSAEYHAQIDEANRIWREEYAPLLQEIQSKIHARSDLAAAREAEKVIFKDYDNAIKGRFSLLEEAQQLFQKVKQDKWLLKHKEPERYLDAWTSYRRLAGEVEARDTASRMRLTPEQRQAKEPYTSQRIKPQDMNVVRNGVPLNDIEADDLEGIPGQEYVPMLRGQEVKDYPKELGVGPRRRAYTVPEEPVRREPIIRELEKAFGTRIYKGHIRGNRLLGFHRPKRGEVRTKHYNDLEVTAHEIAHWLDYEFPMFKEAYHKGVYKEELKGVSYDVKSVKEGFAEFMRLFMTQEPEAVQAAPKFYDKFVNMIEGTELEAPILKIQEMMHQWYYQGALKRFQSKIGEPPVGMREYLKDITDGMVDNAIQKGLDKWQGIKAMEREVTGDVGGPDSPYMNARLTAGARGITRAVFEHGTIDWNDKGEVIFTGPSLRDIFEPVADVMDEAMVYFAARRAAELRAQGRENLFEIPEIAAALKLGDQYPKIKEAFAEYQQFNSRMMDFYEHSGIVGPESRAAMEQANQNYVPFNRIMEAMTGEKQVSRKPFKRLRGGTQNVADIFDNITHSVAALVHTAVINKAKQSVYKTIKASRKGAKFATEIPTKALPTRITMDQIDRLLMELGLETAIEPSALADFATFWTFGNAPRGMDVDAVMVNGKNHYYQVADPLLMESMQAFGAKPIPLALRIGAGFKSALTTMVTSMPDFQLPNIMRDSFMSYTLSKGKIHGGLPGAFAQSLRGMVNRMHKDASYWQYMANGGGYASTIHGETQELRGHLERFYTDRGIDYRTVLDAPGKLFRALQEFNSAFEYGTRLAEYNRLRKQGANMREATYAGREISTDFAMRGTSDFLRSFTTTVPFMNARLQGLYKLAREVHERGGDMRLVGANVARFALRGTLGITLPSLALYFLNKDDDRYRALPDWVKDLHWVIFVPGSDTPFLIPKPFEVGAMFATVPERTFELIEEQDGKEFADAMGFMFMDAMSLNPTPQAIKPFVDLGFNRKFTGAQIIPDDLKDIEPAEQYRPWTSETMIELGRAANVSPMAMESIVRGYTGTLGMYLLMGTDALLRPAEMGEAPAWRSDAVPVLRRFHKDHPYQATSYERDFYNMASEVRMVANTVAKLKTEGRAGRLEQYLSEDEKLIYQLSAPKVSEVQRKIAQINRMQRLVSTDPKMSGNEKRKEIDRLQQEKNELLKQAVELRKEIQPNR